MDQPNFADSVPTSNLITFISGTRESGKTTCSRGRGSTTSPPDTTTSPCGIRDRLMRSKLSDGNKKGISAAVYQFDIFIIGWA